MPRPPCKCVLLVEDSRDDSALAKHALAHAGLADVVWWVEDGEAALAAVHGPRSEGHRDGLRLILLDIKLPKLGGVEVVRRLKADERTKRIPVVMLTSSGEARDVAACYDAGANGYVVKGADYAAYARGVVEAVRYWTGVNTSITECGEVHRGSGA